MSHVQEKAGKRLIALGGSDKEAKAGRRRRSSKNEDAVWIHDWSSDPDVRGLTG